MGGVPGQNANGGPFTFDESLSSYTLIEGVTLTGGLATGGTPPEANNGGGLHCNARGAGAVCSPAIRHVYFSGNAAQNDGGLYKAGYLSVEGGWVGGTSSPDIRYATFGGNAALSNGGAMSNAGFFGTSSPTIRHSTFSGNQAWRGGAIYNTRGDVGTSNPTIAASILWGNSVSSNMHASPLNH